MMRYKYIICVSVLLCGAGLLPAGNVFAQGNAGGVADVQFFGRCVAALADVIVHDITSPPVAGRDYVYPLIAAYEAARPGDPGYASFAGRLNELHEGPAPLAGVQYDWLVASATAYYKTGYAFVFTKTLFRQNWAPIDADLHKRAVDAAVYARSVAFGEQIAAWILDWSKKDHYIETRGMKRFTPAGKPGTWQQTGPEYMEAVEPYWNQIRTMTLSRPDQFLLPEPASFTSARFAEEKKEVSETTEHLTEEQRACAAFWDCNPFAVTTVGHLVYSVKKISPGGHWIGVTGLIIAREKQTLIPALYAYSLVSVAIFDGFIAAWDEKYRTNYIRPITAIQQSGLPVWQPYLQTPPFPEYPSAHSVISMAAAMVLTSLYGGDYHYTDVTETAFGLPERSFTSFVQASAEAAVSRMYGGIHFREAVENGKDLGRAIGTQIVEKFGLHR